MATYNSQTLNDYFKNRDWLGAADYLSSLQASNPRKQDELDGKIRELRRQGEIQRALLQNMSTDQQNAFNFINAIDGSGILPKDNPNTTKFNDLINNLRVTEDAYTPGGRNINGEHINQIRLDIHSDDTYKKYLSNIGVTHDNINSLGIKVTRDRSTGHWFVDIPVSNLKASDYIYAADNLKTDLFFFTTPREAYTDPIKDYDIKGITSSNIIMNENQFNYDNIREIHNIIDNARAVHQKAIDQQTVSLQEDIVVTPFLGHGHANAYKRLSTGAISIDDYNKIVEERTNTYNTLLKQVGLQNYTVYTTQSTDEDKEGLIFKQIEDKDKNKIMQQILVAMNDKRLTYSAAIHEGEVGTYITITGATDKDKNQVSGEYGQPMRIFVPGLFKSSCDESFNSDTKQMSVRDNADMRRWNYGKFLKNGEYVGYDKEMGAYKLATDENGNEIKIPISTDNMLQLLNEENIINQSVSKLLQNIDNEGNPLSYIANGKTYTYDIEERAQTLANVATNELYPKGKYSDGERLQYANDIYNIIMKQLSKSFYKRNKE